MDYIVCHYHEIALKGKNRSFFEDKLITNIKKALGRESFDFVKKISGRVLVKVNKKAQKKELEKKLKKVFGLAYFGFAASCSQNMEDLKSKTLELLREKRFKTFRITTKRSKKSFSLTSQEINERLGKAVVEKLNKKVDLDNPELTLFVEIVQRYAFLYSERVEGLRGLPVTVSGKAVVLLSGGIDSPVASFLTMKRGTKAIFVHFHAHPYTGKESIKKTERIVRSLTPYQFQSHLYLIPFAFIQKKILLNTPASLRVILYRRFMLRIAQEIARKEKALALVTGDSVGQVASQTLENIGVISEAVDLPIFRPLISQDKEEIIEKAKDIGTFDISILPHQDCCARFLPKHPATKARLKDVKRAEEKLEIEKLVREAVKKASRQAIKKL